MEKKYMKGERKRSKDKREYEKEFSTVERKAEGDILKAQRKDKTKDLAKAEKRENELAKLNHVYSSEQLRRKRSFEKEDKQRKKTHKAVWLLIHSTSPASTSRVWKFSAVMIVWQVSDQVWSRKAKQYANDHASTKSSHFFHWIEMVFETSLDT